jgi:hypothetical protein
MPNLLLEFLWLQQMCKARSWMSAGDPEPGSLSPQVLIAACLRWPPLRANSSRSPPVCPSETQSPTMRRSRGLERAPMESCVSRLPSLPSDASHPCSHAQMEGRQDCGVIDTQKPNHPHAEVNRKQDAGRLPKSDTVPTPKGGVKQMAERPAQVRVLFFESPLLAGLGAKNLLRKTLPLVNCLSTVSGHKRGIDVCR